MKWETRPEKAAILALARTIHEAWLTIRSLLPGNQLWPVPSKGRRVAWWNANCKVPLGER